MQAPIHALAFVKWGEYRRQAEDHYEPPQFFYASGKPRIENLVGSGGTLWVVTSRRLGGRRRYSLAFKLVSCFAREPDEGKRSSYGEFMVQSRDWRNCRYYSFNHDITDELLALSFMKKGDAPGKIGERIQSVKRLAPGDVLRLERVEDKLLSERMVFISYARRDRRFAARLEKELIARGVNTWRDVAGLRADAGSDSGLQPGVEWELTLERIARGTDSVVVLVSRNSADSPWVQREVAWALDAREKTNLVKLVLPILLPGGRIESFPRLTRIQSASWPARSADSVIWHDRLAALIRGSAAREPIRETRF